MVDNDVNTQGVGGWTIVCESDCYGAQYHHARDCLTGRGLPSPGQWQATVHWYSLSHPAVGNRGLTCLYVVRMSVDRQST